VITLIDEGKSTCVKTWTVQAFASVIKSSRGTPRTTPVSKIALRQEQLNDLNKLR